MPAAPWDLHFIVCSLLRNESAQTLFAAAGGGESQRTNSFSFHFAAEDLGEFQLLEYAVRGGVRHVKLVGKFLETSPSSRGQCNIA